MPRYLIRSSYTAEGARGLLREGGSSRREASRRLIERLGGRVEAFYYAFGEDDVYIIAEYPDNATAAAVSLAVGSSGAVRTTTVVLLTPEEVDEATGKSVEFVPPGT
jgi:uncharacterized protein with GYD domain